MTAENRDFVNEVKERVDIVDVVSDYVNLKKTGKNYKALCPFHKEKTPSFTVNPTKQFYYCFGCGAGGDVFNFLMEIENITFKESLKLLTDRAGLEMPDQSEADRKRAKLREKLFKLNDLAAKFYNYLLQEHKVGKQALEYLENRGFDENDINRFKLGFAPDKWDSLLNFLVNKGYKPQNLVKAGLIIKKNNNKLYDRFRNRVIFPIFNIRGEVLAFGGRILDEKISQPKYLNSPETLIYDKGKSLYGLNNAHSSFRKKNEAIVMEGYTDVLTAHKFNIKSAVASLGTSLTSKQARLLKRYVSSVYIAYDADTAGTGATLRGLDILKNEGLKVRVIVLPPNEDPDDFIQDKGEKAFLKLKEKALTLVEFKVNQILNKYNVEDPEDKINITHNVVEIIAELEDPVEREIYSQQIAQKLDLDTNLIYSEVERKYKNNNKKDKNDKNRYTKNVNKTKTANSINILRLEKNILKTYIDYPEIRNFIKEKLEAKHFQNKSNQNIFKLLKKKKITEDLSWIEDINNKKLYNSIMKLIINEENENALKCIEGWIKKLKSNYYFKQKEKLYKKLQKTKIETDTLNKLLVIYQKLNIESRKEVI
ncbi:MAG: DNA primase [Halanaerobiales bacterium]